MSQLWYNINEVVYVLQLLAQGAKYVFILIIYYFLFNFFKIMLNDINREQTGKKETGYFLVEENGKKHTLYNINTIGRASDTDIIVDDPHISSKHALITKKGRRIILQDLHSTNGSFVNGKRVRKPIVLKEKDEIILGDKKFTLLRSERLESQHRDYL